MTGITLIPRRKFADALGVCKRTVIRRERADPSFPKTISVNGYQYFNKSEADAYIAEIYRRGLEAPIVTEDRILRLGKHARSRVA